MAKRSTTEITHVSWGSIEVTINGNAAQFKDCKVWPGGAEAWDWRITGTRHNPGTQPADIESIINQGVDVLVLSRGMELVLQTCQESIELLRSKQIEFHVEETTFAVELFNTLSRQGKRVGGIFHSTC